MNTKNKPFKKAVIEIQNFISCPIKTGISIKQEPSLTVEDEVSKDKDVPPAKVSETKVSVVSETKVSVTKMSKDLKVIDSDLGQTKVTKTRVTRSKISRTDKPTGGETAAQAKLRAKILAEQSKPIEAKKSKEIVSKDTTTSEESGRKTRQSKADKFKDSETAKLWANVPESKGNIHILRKHLYCTKLNLTIYLSFFAKTKFFRQIKGFPFSTLYFDEIFTLYFDIFST